MTNSQSSPKRRSRKGQLYTPKAKQSRVIAAALAGKTGRQISREQNISRPAIRRILNQSEVKALLAGYQDEARELLPWALKVCRRNLRGKRPIWQLAVELLKGLQVLMSRQEKEVTQFGRLHLRRSGDELREYLKTGHTAVHTKAALTPLARINCLDRDARIHSAMVCRKIDRREEIRRCLNVPAVSQQTHRHFMLQILLTDPFLSHLGRSPDYSEAGPEHGSLLMAVLRYSDVRALRSISSSGGRIGA